MRISTLNASGYIHNQSSARPLCRHVPLYTPHIRRLRVRDQTAHWTPNLYCDLYPRCGIFPKRWGIGPAAFSRNSIHRARSASTLEMEGIQKPQGSVVIIGAGTQGRRLAHMWSSRGGTVRLVDLQEQQLQDGLKYVEQLRADATDHDGDWGQIETSQPSSLQSTLQDAWLVVECVPENLQLKRKLITQLDKLAPEGTIIASNSSSYGIFEIIEGMNLKNSKRVMSAHCYWPPETSAIEIMGHKDSDPKLIDLVLGQCKEHGFSPFHVKQDSIGYIYNRIWAAIKRETLLTLSEGVATPKEIDAIFKDVLKTPKGPCEQMDVVGLDVVLDIENHYAETRSGIPTEPREYLREMIQGGSLGVKNGQGFYDYEEQNK